MGIRVKALGWWMVSLLSVAGLAAPGSDLRVVEAVKRLDKEAVRSLLQQHVDVNTPQGDGSTALSLAANWNDMEMVELLIHAGAKVNAADDLGATPLWVACSNGNAAIVERLLTAGADAKAALRTGETVLMQCARTGNAEGVKSLLACGVDVNAKEMQRGQTALMWAVSRKHPEVAQQLIEQGADIHARSQGGFTPLLFAARSGDVDSARRLVAAGANVNDAAADGMTPLLIASASGQEETAIFLVEKGADPNAADYNGITALHFALQRGISLLRSVGAAITVASYGYFYRPNMRELVKALLAHHANPNARIVKDPEWAGYLIWSSDHTLLGNATPFLLAAATGDVGTMRALVAAGADPQLTARTNATALMVASAGGSVRASRANRGQAKHTEEGDRNSLEAVKYGVELGIDVNATDDFGETALHFAAYRGVDSIVQFLVDKGAKMDVKDQFGMTPLSIAEGITPPGFPELYTTKKPTGARKSTAGLLRKLGASVTISANEANVTTGK
jgi:uncharacterized protein